MNVVAVSDAEAIEQSLDDPQGFVFVFERHHATIVRYLRGRVGEDLGDELAGETFARAFKLRSRYRAEHESALPWLYGIASRLVAEHRRAERRRLRALERLARASPDALAARSSDVDPIAPEIVHELRRLPATERDALLLVAWGELNYEETAAALDVPIGTVRSRISRARQRLRGSFPAHPVTKAPGEAHA